MNKNDYVKKDELTHLMNYLSAKSINREVSPYRLFSWPETLPDQTYWMSKHLMTIYSTTMAEQLDETTLYQLSKWESIHFYSLNVHGIRELLFEIVKRIHMPGYELMSNFLHHFIGEENEHMWFFSEFCRRYGQKIYPSTIFKTANTHDDDNLQDIDDFLVFARILIFEEMVDFYNVQMANDIQLHPTIRQINHVHHQDEMRHITFGRKLVTFLYQNLREHTSQNILQSLEVYLKKYMTYNIKLFYNPSVYKDAGIPNPLDFRALLLASESRREIEQQIIKKTLAFFIRIGVFSDSHLPSIMNH